jgi:peptidoglycan/LPS O-acetylase OafA/YrhL
MIAQLCKKYIAIRFEFLCVLVLVCYFTHDTNAYFYFFAIATAYFCFWFAYRLPYVNIQKYGDPSYGIYLWGWPVQQILVFMSPAISPMANAFLAAAISAILGYVSWHVLEKHALSFKKVPVVDRLIITSL